MKTANQGGNDIPWDFVLKTGGSLLTAIDGQLSYCFDCLCLWRCCDACCHCNISGNYYSYWTVRLSVRPSVCHAPVLYRNALTYQRILFLAYGSPIILNTFAKFRQGHPYGGIEYRWMSTNVWPICGKRRNTGPQLLWNSNRKSHVLYRTVTLRWPWVTFEGHFVQSR